MDTILELLKSIAEWFWSAVGTMIERLISEPNYRAGFGACFVFLVVSGTVSTIVAYAIARIKKFFSATAAPPKPSTGPTPVGLGEGCLEGIIILIVVAVVGLFLLSQLGSP